jgi:exopolysaccharide biosynthesis protein
VRVRTSETGLLVSELAAEARVLAALNANYFDAEGRALGWVVSDGELISGLGREGWGVLSAGSDGRIRVQRPAAVADEEGAEQAIQAGPLLVEGGVANPGLKTQSARRVFAGLDADGRLVLGSTGVARADAPKLAARLARSESEGGAGLREVLNLDGGSSAQLFIRGGRGDADLIEPGLARVPVLLTLERRD